MFKKPKLIVRTAVRIGIIAGILFLLSLTKAPSAEAANCVTAGTDQYSNAIVYVRLRDNTGNFIGTVPYQLLVAGYDPYVGVRSPSYDPNGLDRTILDGGFGFRGFFTVPYKTQAFNVRNSTRTGVDCDNLPDITGDGTNGRGRAMPFDRFPNQFRGLIPHVWSLNARPNGDPYSYGYNFKLQNLPDFPTYTPLGYTIYVPDGTFASQPAGPLRLRYNAGDPGVDPTTANLNPKVFDQLMTNWGAPPLPNTSADLTHKTFYIYFDVKLGAGPPPSIDLSVSDLSRGTSGGSIDAYLNDEIGLDWSTTSAASCTASNDFGGNWTGAKDPNPPTTEVRDTPPNNDTSAVRLIHYTLTCVNSDGVSSSSTVAVNVQKIKYYPFLQVFNGDVAALGIIHGQQIGKANGRQYTPDPYDSNDQNDTVAREAEYLVMAAGNNTPPGNAITDTTPANIADTVLNFCSSSVNRSIDTNSPVFASYNLGQDGTDNGIETNGCHSSAYVLNLTSEFLLPPAGSTDLVIYNLQRGIAANANPAPVCTPTKPYYINPTTYAGVLNSSSFNNLNATNNCAGIIRYNGNQIDGLSPAWGRGTIYVTPPSGTLRITKDIAYNFNLYPAYKNSNDVPNLGIVVNGNVEISGNVGYIDAAIYATGSINTCYEGVIDNLCKGPLSKPLQVRGALLAKKLGYKFNRGFYNTVNSPAEVIYANGSWLNSPPPGLEDRYSQYSTKVTYLGETYPVFNTLNAPSTTAPVR